MVCRRSRASSWSNSPYEPARDMFFKPQVFGMGNHLGQFSEPSEGPVRAVGGQGQLRGVT